MLHSFVYQKECPIISNDGYFTKLRFSKKCTSVQKNLCYNENLQIFVLSNSATQITQLWKKDFSEQRYLICKLRYSSFEKYF